MKIDLHCHTKAIKSGDPLTRNVTSEDFKKYVNSANVKLVAITNHNCFDILQYKEFVATVNGDFMIWPGIELDITGLNSESGHIILICNPENVEQFNEKIINTIGDASLEDYSIEIDKLIELANGMDCIIQAHYLKPKSLDFESLQYISEHIKDSYRFFYEASNYKSMGILINHKYRGIIGSDIKDWQKYDQVIFPNLKLDIDSFSQFLLLSKKDSSIVETLLNKKSKVRIDVGYRSEIEEIDIYDDVNIIFGTKGTGKSIVLDNIKNFFDKKGINSSYYTPSETKDKISDKLSIEDQERQLDNYGLDNCFTQFEYIKQWSEKAATAMKDYLDYVKCLNENKNKAKMKILETDTIKNNIDTNLKGYLDDIRIVNEILNLYSTIELEKYLDLNDIENIYIINQKIKQSAMLSMEEEWYKYQSVNLSNNCISSLKRIVEKNTELKTKPNDSGLYDLIDNRLKLEININDIYNGFNYSIDEKIADVGYLEKNKLLQKKRICKMLDKKSTSAEFNSKISNLKECQKFIFDIKDQLDTKDVAFSIQNFKQCCVDNTITSLDDFLGVSKEFQLNNLTYTPSTGEATMIILQEKLNENVDVYLLDEPEKSLGNTYINDVIVPKICELATNRKTIVIATHNANIAVRTFPYMSIYKEYENGSYNTYLGNPFSNNLINLKDNSIHKSWKEESMRVLEGGKEAFEERSEIYE